MQFERIYLDSNVFIRAFEGALDDEVAQDLIGIFGLSGNTHHQAFVTSQITLAEVLVQPLRAGDVARQLQYKLLLSGSGNWLEVVPIRRAILLAAASLRANSRMKLPDAIHAATAEASGCSHILTGDTDFGDGALGLNAATTDALLSWLRS